MQVLTGHTSAETAYVVADYPYGFRLRTQIRYWVETKAGHGQRMMSQTMNPKTGRWNKPNASIYSPALALTLDDNGHVEHIRLSPYANDAEITAFETQAPDDNHTRGVIRYMRAARRAEAKMTWSIHECLPGCTIQHQTIREQAEDMARATRYELHKESAAAMSGISVNDPEYDAWSMKVERERESA